MIIEALMICPNRCNSGRFVGDVWICVGGSANMACSLHQGMSGLAIVTSERHRNRLERCLGSFGWLAGSTRELYHETKSNQLHSLHQKYDMSAFEQDVHSCYVEEFEC